MRTGLSSPVWSFVLNGIAWAAMALVPSFHTQERPDGQNVHACAFKAIDRFFRPAHNRFVFIEAGIQDYGRVCFALEGANQIIVERILLAADALQSTGVVSMIDRAQLGTLFGPNLVHVQHEWRWVIVLEVFALAFLKNRRSKWTKPLALLDACIQDVFHSW